MKNFNHDKGYEREVQGDKRTCDEKEEPKLGEEACEGLAECVML